jgi:hypothetical protein
VFRKRAISGFGDLNPLLVTDGSFISDDKRIQSLHTLGKMFKIAHVPGDKIENRFKNDDDLSYFYEL